MKLKRVLPLSLMLVSLSLIASIGMSVAWYANGAYLRVSNIDVSLMSDPELGISLTESNDIDDYHFGEFPYDELPKMKGGYSETYDDELETEENQFVPVSSMFSDDWIGKTDEEGNKLDPQFCTNYKRASIYDETTYRKTKIAKSGFYSVPLYLICNHDMYVGIDSLNTIFTANIEANKKRAESIISKDKSVSYDDTLEGLNAIVNSLRFSVYDCVAEKYWIIDPTKGETTTYLAGTLDLDANKTFDYYFDGEHYKEYLFGEYENPENVIYKDNVDQIEPSSYDTFTAKHGDEVEAVDMDYYINNKLLKEEDSYTPDELSNVDMIALTNHVPHRIVLSIYIEGWDRDNTQVSALGAFYSSIKFKLTRPNYAS